MSASYPGSSVSFTPRVDLTDTVVANDVNSLYAEVTAIANTVGLTPQTRSANWGIGSFSSANTSFSTVASRIQNAENGVFTVINDYVRLSGGSVVLPTGTSTVNLALRAATSQTANLLEARNSSGTVVASIGPAGAFRALSIDGGNA
jgi:hypothetical protein